MSLIGLSMDASADSRRFPGGKNALLFEALDRRFGVEAVLWPGVPPAHRRLLQVRAFHPDRDAWRRRFNLHPRTFAARTARARALLTEHPAGLVVQLHTLMGPGCNRPYVLHTDGAYLLTERYYPEGAPLRGRARARFLALETEIYRGAAALFPRSAWLARAFVEDYGCDPRRVVVVGAGNNLPLLPLEGRRWIAGSPCSWATIGDARVGPGCCGPGKGWRRPCPGRGCRSWGCRGLPTGSHRASSGWGS